MTVSVLAFIAGTIITASAIIVIMRRSMILKYPIRASFDVVREKLEAAVRSVPGWGLPIPAWDFHATVAKTHAFRNVKRIHIFFICKAEYAKGITDAYPHMCAMMPCAWAIYETKSGKVFLAKMNISMMGKMFSGNVIGKNMGTVAKEEHLMLRELRKLLAEN